MQRKTHFINFQIIKPNSKQNKNSCSTSSIFGSYQDNCQGSFSQCLRSHNSSLDLLQISKIINCKPMNMTQFGSTSLPNQNQLDEIEFPLIRSDSFSDLNSNGHTIGQQLKQGKDMKSKAELKQKQTVSVQPNDVYLIPAKYINTLKIMVRQFLNFKLAYRQTQNQKRTRTACKTSQGRSNNFLIGKQNFMSSSVYKQQLKKQEMALNFNYYAQVQKQISSKNKKIVQLQRQICLYSQKLGQKNQHIKMLQEREAKLKTKVKEQYQKLNRGRNIFDLQSLKQQNLNKLNLTSKIHSNQKLSTFFNINGSTIQKKNGVSDFQIQRQVRTILKKDSSQQPQINKKQSDASKQLSNQSESLKISDKIEELKNQIGQLQSQRDLNLDRLTQNRAKMQKYNQEIQRQINIRHNTMTRYQEELRRQNLKGSFQRTGYDMVQQSIKN